MDREITPRVDGQEHRVVVDVRTSLLDVLRERLGITSPEKGCDHGQCGAPTVRLGGRRALSCPAPAVQDFAGYHFRDLPITLDKLPH
ncbi:2Fe-2S iron-sulfur cluster-binding protein [Streptomyces sp. NPDC003480]